jgi:hypothetical protein
MIIDEKVTKAFVDHIAIELATGLIYIFECFDQPILIVKTFVDCEILACLFLCLIRSYFSNETYQD